MQQTRAVFLDRDGVINAAILRDGKPFPPHTIQDFRFLPNVHEACNLLHQAGFVLVIATNQPDVGRGELDRSVVEQMHSLITRELPISRIEVCYDPGNGTPSEFRKPKPGMLLRAANTIGIDLKSSYMIGDRWRDIDCGHAAGCTTIFIDRNYRESLRMPPHFTAPDLLAAAHIILSSKGEQIDL